MTLYLNCVKEPEQKSWNKADYLLAAAKRLSIDVELYKGQPNPEYILNIEPFQYFYLGSKWTGVWEIDVLLDRKEMETSNWDASDSIFIAVKTLPKRLEAYKERAVLMFQAIDPELHRRIPEIEQKYDFVLSGSTGTHFYHERERVFEQLKRAKFSFYDYGNHHSPAEYIGFLNHARVQFIRSMNTRVAEGELAQRFFECLAIGPVLTNYVSDLTETGLVEGEDYLSYQSDDEMIDKMELLTKDSKFANRIARNGRRKALMYHTYDHRLLTIFKYMEEYEK